MNFVETANKIINKRNRFSATDNCEILFIADGFLSLCFVAFSVLIDWPFKNEKEDREKLTYPVLFE